MASSFGAERTPRFNRLAFECKGYHPTHAVRGQNPSSGKLTNLPQDGKQPATSSYLESQGILEFTVVSFSPEL